MVAKCLGCGFFSFATSCQKIAMVYGERPNGFYWIKSKCMKMPKKVYCDFETFHGNFYYYMGNLNNKAIPLKDHITIKDMQDGCKSLGLKPVILESKDQIETLIHYLNFIEANSEDDIGIALAYDYDCKESCSGHFKSLESNNS